MAGNGTKKGGYSKAVARGGKEKKEENFLREKRLIKKRFQRGLKKGKNCYFSREGKGEV